MVEGELLLYPPATVRGWYRLPGQTRTKAEIEILVDTSVVATIFARHTSDGAGDGRLAFSLNLPATPHERASCVIEARERGSGIVFGRVVWCEEAIAELIEHRLDGLDVGRLKRPLSAVPDDPATRLRRNFSALGTALLEAGGIAVVGSARAALARQMPRLPLSNTPVVSVIMQASPCIRTTLRSLAALQSLAHATRIEVIVADDGAEPLSALLQRACPQLRYRRDPAGLTGSVLNTLVGEARGDMICFLDHDLAAGDWHWPQPEIADRQVHLGCRLAGRADWPAAMRRHDAHGFALYLARTEIFCAGGFEPRLRGMDSYTDLAMKCRLLGAGMTAWLCSDLRSAPRNETCV